MLLSRRGIALATAALQVAAVNRAARAEPGVDVVRGSTRVARRQGAARTGAQVNSQPDPRG